MIAHDLRWRHFLDEHEGSGDLRVVVAHLQDSPGVTVLLSLIVGLDPLDLRPLKFHLVQDLVIPQVLDLGRVIAFEDVHTQGVFVREVVGAHRFVNGLEQCLFLLVRHIVACLGLFDKVVNHVLLDRLDQLPSLIHWPHVDRKCRNPVIELISFAPALECEVVGGDKVAVSDDEEGLEGQKLGIEVEVVGSA